MGYLGGGEQTGSRCTPSLGCGKRASPSKLRHIGQNTASITVTVAVNPTDCRGRAVNGLGTRSRLSFRISRAGDHVHYPPVRRVAVPGTRNHCRTRIRSIEVITVSSYFSNGSSFIGILASC